MRNEVEKKILFNNYTIDLWGRKKNVIIGRKK